jgi:glycosyltransferase involved in cell wall biosynthesis
LRSALEADRPAKLSIVVPIYNEQESIPALLAALETALAPLAMPYQLICVDDGSQDESPDILRQCAQTRPHLTVLLLRRNYGQTAAMAAGV